MTAGFPAELRGAGVVVTGAGSGIGAALARRLAASGARLVVNDLDHERADVVAAQVGGIAHAGDATTDTGAAELVGLALSRFGAVDLFCANAGVGTGGGPQTPDEQWQTAWDVNVMGHVHAARHLLPGWLERGRGHLLATVSAAGLLTMPGAAPYAVTKHAALAFAEWLSVTYGGRGVVVQALCPQGVRTAMLTAAGEVGRVVLLPDAITAEEVAEVAVGALPGERFLVLPHPQVAGYYARRAADPDAWLARMRQTQGRLDAMLGEGSPPFA